MATNDAQRKANEKQNKKRLGQPTFSAVRFTSQSELNNVNNTIEMFGGTREQALVKAFKLLSNSIKQNE